MRTNLFSTWLTSWWKDKDNAALISTAFIWLVNGLKQYLKLRLHTVRAVTWPHWFVLSETSAHPQRQNISAARCFASFFCVQAIRKELNNEHGGKDKEAFNKRGLEQKGGGGVCVEGGRIQLKSQNKTWNIQSDNGTERERYSSK